MRRCPRCQAPNPLASRFCQRCGQALPAVQREPFWAWSDWFEPAALRVLLLPLLALLVFRLSLGAYLSAGLQRQEWRYISFHLIHGLLFGAGLAWVRGDLAAGRGLRWILAGALAGLFAEGLEFWYSYQHVMQTLVLQLVAWFSGINNAAMLPYRSLQALRLFGILLPLGLAWLAWARPRPGQVLAALLWSLAALFLRSRVLGYTLTWDSLFSRLAQENLALYALSALLLLYALGAREKALTGLPQNP